MVKHIHTIQLRCPHARHRPREPLDRKREPNGPSAGTVSTPARAHRKHPVPRGAAGVKGKNADVKGNNADVKGNNADSKGNNVDVKGNNVDGKGNNVDGKGNSVDVKGNNADVKGNSVDVKRKYVTLLPLERGSINNRLGL
eukprot:1178695-Prorocentrum_minimum.AAC.6